MLISIVLQVYKGYDSVYTFQSFKLQKMVSSVVSLCKVVNLLCFLSIFKVFFLFYPQINIIWVWRIKLFLNYPMCLMSELFNFPNAYCKFFFLFLNYFAGNTVHLYLFPFQVSFMIRKLYSWNTFNQKKYDQKILHGVQLRLWALAASDPSAISCWWTKIPQAA